MVFSGEFGLEIHVLATWKDILNVPPPLSSPILSHNYFLLWNSTIMPSESVYAENRGSKYSLFSNLLFYSHPHSGLDYS